MPPIEVALALFNAASFTFGFGCFSLRKYRRASVGHDKDMEITPGLLGGIGPFSPVMTITSIVCDDSKTITRAAGKTGKPGSPDENGHRYIALQPRRNEVSKDESHYNE